MIETGATLGPYLILGQLGEGGMGTVFRARDTRLDREVALKMLPPEFASDPARLARFRQEALAIAALNHPNVATIYGFEEPAAGALFLVLEKVEGESLAERLERGALPIEESLRVCAQVAEALEVAHERGVIHRDIKPGNVMLGPRGLVKVLDFGLAEDTRASTSVTPAPGPAAPSLPPGDGESATFSLGGFIQTIAPGALDATIAPGDPDATIAGSGGSGGSSALAGVSGTPGYMSPEQIRAQPQDARTDVFAFGCVLYECLTGRRAFPGDVIGAMKAALQLEPDYDALPERTPSRVRALLVRTLAKDPAGRLAEARSARLELEDTLGIRRAAALMAGEAPDVAPNNLPRQTSSFVGRQGEIAACVAALGQTRLLTLTGVGGSGKTRLALKVAEVRLADAPDGVWFVDLAPVTDPERVPLTIAAAVGVREEPGQSLLQTLGAHFAPRTALLVLDNCEHLVSASAAAVGALLDAAPDLRILATSREALAIPGESLHGVPTLALPPTDAALTAARLEEFEAARLFIERARQVRPDFAVSDVEAPIVAELCHRLDGIPLAIELAAARLRVLSVAEIRARLDDRFRLLTGGSRTALPRQQTLRATIQWSYDQLVPEEQRFLRALAAFTGGWTLESATAVCDEHGDEFETLDHLTRLVDKSLAVVERGEVTSRYRFLETVRQYALEELNASDEGPAARNRHLTTFERLATEAERGLLGHEQAQWLRRLELEHGNLLAALEWCGKAENGVERGLGFAAAVSRFWTTLGYYELGWSMLKAALDRDVARAPTAARGKALVRAGGLALYRGDYATARPLIEESLAIHRAQGDTKGEARALSGLSTVATYAGDFPAARAYSEESHALYQRLGDRRGEAGALHNLGYIALRESDLARARTVFEETLVLHRGVGDREHTALTLSDLALVSLRLGESARARESLLEALGLIAELGAKREGAYALETAAEFALGSGDPTRAARLGAAAEALREAMGSPLVPSEELERQGFLARIEEAIGPEALAAERAYGRALRFPDAVTHAQEGLRPAAG
ncbi:MAG: protein kinase [Candidatus Eisenbacteria bacterium]